MEIEISDHQLETERKKLKICKRKSTKVFNDA